MSQCADWYAGLLGGFDTGKTNPAMSKMGRTPVLILAESIDKKYRAIARIGSFEIVAWRPSKFVSFRNGRGVPHFKWTLVRKIARRRVHHGKAGYAKLADFSFEEHQAVLSAFNRMLYEGRGSNERGNA